MKNTTNVFLKGMTSDMHPLTISQQEYTDALNATLITFNGNEQMMQNDMGNTKIQDTKTGNIMGLREGFIPVGLKEHGGIMYIASVNKEGVGEIGTIPSPVIRYNQDRPETSTPIPDEITFDSGSIISNTYRLTDVKLKPQEKFLVNIPNEYLSDVSTLTQKKYYKAKLFSKTDKSIIDISDSASTNAYYMLTGGNSVMSDYWFLNLSDISSLDFDRMIALDGTKNQGGENYFIHYPNIAEGYPAIAFEKENILSFDLIENHAQNAHYPILLEDENGEYKICIYGFLFSTESFVEVDKMTIKISDEDNELISKEYTLSGAIGTESFVKTSLSQQNAIPREFLIQKNSIDPPTWIDYIKSLPDDEWVRTHPYPVALLSLNIGDDCNKWFTITVDYYCSKWNDKIGTYSFRYNPYLIDILKTHIIGSSWEPHSFSGQNNFRQYFDIENMDEEIIEEPLIPDSANTISNENIDVSITSNPFKTSNATFAKKWIDFKDNDNNYHKFYPDKNDGVEHLSFTVYNDSRETPTSVTKSNYLKLPLNIQQTNDPNTYVDSILFQISFITNERHNLDMYWESYKTKSDLEFIFSNFKINETEVKINGENSIYVHTGNVRVNGSETSKYKVFVDCEQLIELRTSQGNKVQITDNSEFTISCDMIVKSKYVRRMFPNEIFDELNSTISIIPSITLNKEGYSGYYTVINASNCYVTPQFDYYVTNVQGQEQTIYPGFLSSTNDLHICPILQKNYLSLSGAETHYITNNTSFRINELGVDIAKVVTNYETIFSDNLRKGAYLLITNNSGLKFQCTIDGNTRGPANAILINLNESKRIDIQAVCRTSTNLISSGLYEINKTLIKELPENNEIILLGNSNQEILSNLAQYDIYPQSVFLYGENPTPTPVTWVTNYHDYWVKQNSHPLTGKREYSFAPLPAEGYQNMYQRCTEDKPDGIDITFRTT